MKINFIGGFFPKNKISEYVKNSSGEVHYAANALQQSIISGLQSFEKISTNLITLPFLINFPAYKEKIIKEEVTKDYHIVPYINIKFIDNVTKSISLRKVIKRKIKKEGEDNILLIYGLFDYFLMSIPKNYKNKVCLIVPDLPRMMGGDMNKLKVRMYIWYVETIIKKNIQKVDCFVFLSKPMNEIVNVYNKPWIVIEGIYNDKQNIAKQKKEQEKVILYTGTLDRRYGILNLLEAFSIISEENYRLWICGEGEGKKNVEHFAKRDSRINYYGQIPPETVLELQKRATVLVNPRKNDSEYTKYSFPSKTMEYLASGTPTVMYKLDGVPEEYYQYFFTPEDNSDLALSKALRKVVELPDEQLFSFGEKAKEFVLQNKNPRVQVGKILTLIEQC